MAGLQLALRIVGTALQVAGLVVAAYGVWRTRSDYAPEAPRISALLRTAVKVTISKLGWWFSSVVLRRPRPAQHFHGEAAMTGTGSLSVFGQLSVAPVGSGVSVTRKIKQLDDLTQHIQTRLNALELDVRADRSELASLQELVLANQLEIKSLMDDRIKTLALGGLKLQAWGLSLTAVGTVIAALS